MTLELANKPKEQKIETKESVNATDGAVSQKITDELKNTMSQANDIKKNHLALAQVFVKHTFGDLHFTDSSVVSPTKPDDLNAVEKQAKLRTEWDKASALTAEVQPQWDAIKQGNIGDCFVMSTIKAIAKTQNGPEQLRNMIKQKEDGSYFVKFPGDDKIVEVSPIDIKPGDGIPRGGSQVGGKTDLAQNWPRVLEAALGRYYAEHLQPGKPGTDNPLGKLNEWSGDSDKAQVIELLTGKKADGADIQQSSLLDSQRKYAQENTLGTIRYFWTAMNDRNGKVDNSDNSNLSAPMMEALNNNKIMVSGRGRHAYFISKNPETGKIEIFNPHGQADGTKDVTDFTPPGQSAPAEIILPDGRKANKNGDGKNDGRIAIDQKDLLKFLQQNHFDNTYWLKP